MNPTDLDNFIQQIIESLFDQALLYYQEDGRGLFWVKMETKEIEYIPQKLLDEDVPEEAFDNIMEAIENYSPENQMCLMIVNDSGEMIFHVAEIESEADNDLQRISPQIN